MKQFYQIHELAKLFDLCPDTLRYYEEKGLLHPVRGENRYRMYGIQDVCTLNIIRPSGSWAFPPVPSGPIWSGGRWARPSPCWIGRRNCSAAAWRSWRRL